MANSLICNNCGKPYEGEGSGGTVSSGVVLHRYSKNQSSRGWVCTACGAYHPIMDSEEEGERLYRAFQMLRESDFEGAEEAFDAFLKEYPENAEAHWGKVRAKYRIAYEQGKDGVLVPICSAPNAKSIFKNEDYRKALQYADEDHKKFLTAQAEYIEQSRLAAKPKRIIKRVAVCLTSLLLLVAVSFGVYMLNTRGLKYGKNADGTYSVSDVSILMGTDVEIPAKHNGALVTSIGSYAFFNCSGLTSITIPNSVTSIGELAFYDCDSLTSITIPDSVTSIGDSAFADCDGLASITIPDSVTSIGEDAFYISGLTAIAVAENNKIYCSIDGVLFDKSVTTIVCYPRGKQETEYAIPDGVTSIGDYAFRHCDVLTSVTIGNGVTSIGERAFNYCSSLTAITVDENNENYRSIGGVLFDKSVTTIICYPEGKQETEYAIPDGVTSIGDDAFAHCHKLTSITIPDSVTSIGSSAFYECDSLTSITIPESVTSIGERAFEYCDGLTSITIPESVTSIGDDAFVECDSLTSITIPESVTSIGEDAFLDCDSLTSITIPESVTCIGDDAFHGCGSLTDVYYAGSEEDWAKISIGSSNSYLISATIHYGK